MPARMLFLRKGEAGAVRSGPWKLVRQGAEMNLFNLDDDLGETTNLAGQLPERVQAMDAAWNAWEADVNASAAAYH